MSRPKPISKTKLLRRQLRQAQQDAQTRYDALNRVASEKQRKIEALSHRLQSIGFTSVHERPPGDRYCVAVEVDRREIDGLKNPGHFLADLAAELFTKLAREMPELSDPMPEKFYAALRTLPTRERRAKLMPLYDGLRRRVYDDYSKVRPTAGNYPFCPDADASKLFETFDRTLTFPSFCHLLEILEENAHLIHS